LHRGVRKVSSSPGSQNVATNPTNCAKCLQEQPAREDLPHGFGKRTEAIPAPFGVGEGDCRSARESPKRTKTPDPFDAPMQDFRSDSIDRYSSSPAGRRSRRPRPEGSENTLATGGGQGIESPWEESRRGPSAYNRALQRSPLSSLKSSLKGSGVFIWSNSFAECKRWMNKDSRPL